MPNYVSLSEAKQLLGSAERVLVVGCSGGGKTTLSVKLSESLALPLISIDRDIRWLPEWTERDKEQQRALIADYVKQSRWVMDGSGASSFDLRLPYAELVLWVRVPRHVALKGLAGRVKKNYGSVRSHMADGCPEGLPDIDFLSYIWNFEKRHAPEFVKQIDLHGATVPVCVLNSREMINQVV